MIFKDDTMKENNMTDIIIRLKQILNSERYYNMLNDPKVNWLDLTVNEVIKNVIDYFSSFETIEV